MDEPVAYGPHNPPREREGGNNELITVIHRQQSGESQVHRKGFESAHKVRRVKLVYYLVHPCPVLSCRHQPRRNDATTLLRQFAARLKSGIAIINRNPVEGVVRYPTRPHQRSESGPDLADS